MKFEEKIKALRKGKNLTQNQLAQMLGVTRPCISKWESAYTMPSIETLIELAKIFSISLDELLSDHEMYLLSEEAKKLEEEIFVWFLESITRRVKHSIEIEDKLFDKSHRTII